MKFRTEYKPSPLSLTLSPLRPVVLIGSCFTQNIAAKMTECGWEAFNGAGTLYNPLSIAKVLDLLMFERNFLQEAEKSLFQSEGKVHSWLFDTHFSRASVAECMEAIQECRTRLLDTLERAEALVVTFGTSWCYFLQDEKGYVVANCHKMPQSVFDRRRISISEISGVWTNLCARLRERFPGLSVIFTVSPVRHLKDGFEGNSRSKATLLLAVEEICAGSGNHFYFPAFEIVGDDLRDYRFYASDLVHPSDSAVEYIWEIFRQTFVDAEGERLLKEGNKKFRFLNHRQIFKA